jgi:toxin YoeB
MSKRIIFTRNAWEDYTSWQNDDRKTLKKINSLIKDIQNSPYEGVGKPEPLKYDLAGLWSRRIDREHRLIYSVVEADVLIYSCRYHYDNK